MSSRQVFAACSALCLALGADISEPPALCEEPIEESEAHEVLLLQVETTAHRATRTVNELAEHEVASTAIGRAAASAGVQAALAQHPSYSEVLVPEGKLAACLAIYGPWDEETVGSPECRQPVSREDVSRPFEDVLAEHPGVNGWCHYGGLGSWISTCAAAMEARSYVALAVQYGAISVLGANGENEEAEEWDIGPPHVLGYQGENFFTDYNYLAYDSQYCLDNGWLNQTRYRLEDVHDFDRMTELEQSYCNELLEEFPELHGYSMADHLDFAGVEQTTMDHEGRLPFGLRSQKSPTPFENRRHAAWKCAMGGLGCDITNCIYTYCALDEPVGLGTFIGHGVQCREDWLSREDVEVYVDTIGNGVNVPPFL